MTENIFLGQMIENIKAVYWHVVSNVELILEVNISRG